MSSEKQPDKAFKLSPSEYRQVLAGLKLLDVELAACHLEVNIPVNTISGTLKGHVRPGKATMSVLDEDGTVLVSHQYSLTGKDGKDVVLRLRAKYLLRFKSTEAFTEEFFDIFSQLNLSKQTWPFFRELASTLTGKTSLPRLTLPLLM